MAAAGRPTIRLQCGPGDGQIYYLDDFLQRILSAQRMGHTTPDGPGWALGYKQAAGRHDLGLARSQLPPRAAG